MNAAAQQRLEADADLAALDPRCLSLVRWADGRRVMTSRVSLSITCLVLAVVSLPMILGKVPPNSTYGFRTRLTLSSPDIWYAANAFSGWSMLIAAAICLATLWFLPEGLLARPWIPIASFLVPVGLSLLASLIYLRRFQ